MESRSRFARDFGSAGRGRFHLRAQLKVKGVQIIQHGFDGKAGARELAALRAQAAAQRAGEMEQRLTEISRGEGALLGLKARVEKSLP